MPLVARKIEKERRERERMKWLDQHVFKFNSTEAQTARLVYCLLFDVLAAGDGRRQSENNTTIIVYFPGTRGHCCWSKALVC